MPRELPANLVRVLVAPCGCFAGADATLTIPGFCRTEEEAQEDIANGFREETVGVATYRASRPCAHTPTWGVQS